jgi:CAAX prenyl protease-like protein
MGILRNIGETLVPKVVRQIAAPILLLLLLLYYMVNGPLIFGALWSQPGFSNAIIAYILFVFAAFMFSVVPAGNPIAGHLFKPVSASLLMQLGVFVAVSLIVNTLIVLSGLSLLAITGVAVVQVALFQLAVAGSEELFFRGAMFKFGPLISSGMFAGFHAYVYSSSPSFLIAILFAGVAGTAFFYLYTATRERFGLAVPTAAHFSYNCGLFGIALLGPLFSALFGA